jgi:hypothetical protein
MGLGGRISFRLAVIGATFASVLVPAWVAPARTISAPETMVRTVSLDSAIAKRSSGALELSFPATHVAFSWTGSEDVTIVFRTSPDEPWVEAPIAHDADTATRHYTGVQTVDKPESLEWDVRREPGVVIADLTLDYLNTLDGPRVERTVPATAGAEARTPNIVTRAEWGADESLKRTTGSCRRQFHPLGQLFVHHTAGSNFDGNPKATMRAIYWFHVVRQGWCDIGYNFVVSHDGRIFEGRWARSYSPWEVHDSESKSGEPVAGAHVSGFNSGSVGISVMGNFQTARPSPATRRALAELLAWEIDRHDLQARGTHVYRNPESGQTKKLPWIAGHRDAGSTSCPGDLLYAALRSVRRDAAAVMGAGKTATSVAVTASATRIKHGETVSVAGTLTDSNGVPLASRPIRTYVKEGGKDWLEGPSATTAPDGTFGFALQPSANLQVAAIYDGDAATWGSEDATRVLVAPTLSIVAEEGAIDQTGASHFPPGTSEIRFSGTVTPRHSGSAVEVRIAKLGSDGRFTRVDKGSAVLGRWGHFAVDWTVVDPGVGGTYQAHAFLPKHKDHTWGASPVVTFVIDPQP